MFSLNDISNLWLKATVVWRLFYTISSEGNNLHLTQIWQKTDSHNSLLLFLFG